MNLILVRDHERHADDSACLRGVRARHVREVLKASVGDFVRLGLPDGPCGRARVTTVENDRVELRWESLDDQPPAPPRCDLILAVPRPKVLGRILEHVAALGVGTICLVRTWRVEKSYLQSDLLEEETLREHLLTGLEQARDTRVPKIVVEPLFRPFVEDRLDAHFPSGRRIACHPGATDALMTCVADADEAERLVIAIGPEGGFTAFEVELLERHGFSPAHLGDRVLRVETACTAVLARLGALFGG